jgi:hypothetical protein
MVILLSAAGSKNIEFIYNSFDADSQAAPPPFHVIGGGKIHRGSLGFEVRFGRHWWGPPGAPILKMSAFEDVFPNSGLFPPHFSLDLYSEVRKMMIPIAIFNQGKSLSFCKQKR